MKKYFKILTYPLLLIILQFLLIFLFTLIFNFNTSLEVNSLEYNLQLSAFLNDYKLLITIITFIILTPFVIRKVEKTKEKSKNIIKLIVIGISFALTFNLLLYSLNKLFNFTNLFDDNNTNILITLICSGILGPILEELIFRGIVYNNLKKITSGFKAVIISSLIFGLFHGNIIQFVYGFIFNIILTKIYDRDNNILSPIIVHISANTIITLALFIIKKLNIYLSLISLIIFLIIFIVMMYKYIKIEQNKNVNNC